MLRSQRDSPIYFSIICEKNVKAREEKEDYVYPTYQGGG